MTKTVSDCFPLRGLIAIAISVTIASSTLAQGANLNKLVGDWELTKITDSSVKRTVNFAKKSGHIVGVFVDASGQSKTITDIRFKDGAYSFRVPDLKLVFKNVKFVGKDLEGNMIDDSQVKGRLVPQAIRMTKK